MHLCWELSPANAPAEGHIGSLPIVSRNKCEQVRWGGAINDAGHHFGIERAVVQRGLSLAPAAEAVEPPAFEQVALSHVPGEVRLLSEVVDTDLVS
jgi:hypothetical protein